MIVNNSNNNNITFSSRNNPIRPFSVQTTRGLVHFQEVNYKHLAKKSNGFYKKFAEFFTEIFANTSAHPDWMYCRKPIIDVEIYEDYINRLAKMYKGILKHRDTTLLVGRDDSKNIVGAILTKVLNETPTVRDSDTMYVESIAVLPKYRGNSLGTIMLETVMQACSERFTDTFLVAYKESVPFYDKLNFRTLHIYQNERQDFLITEMAKDRGDEFPMFVEFMTRPMGKYLPMDWFSRVEYRNMPKW